MSFPIGALIGGVGSLAGIGLNAALGQDNSNWKHYKNRILATVMDAQRAGIHPLAALGASGLGGEYGSSPITWGDSIGQGMQAFGNSLDDYMSQDADRVDRARQASELRSRDALDRAQASADRRYDAMRQARQDALNERYVNSQIMLNEAQSRSMIARARAAAQGASAGGNNWPAPTSPESHDTQWFENRYGNGIWPFDPSGAYGLLKLLGDDYRFYKGKLSRWAHGFPAARPGLSTGIGRGPRR